MSSCSLGPGGERFPLPGPEEEARHAAELATYALRNRGRYFEFGCDVKALGRGHIQRIKEEERRSAWRRVA